MNHVLLSRPVIASVAALAAVTVTLAGTTAEPPKPVITMAMPSVSIDSLALASSSTTMAVSPRTVAAAPANQINPGQVVQNAIGAFVGGIATGAFLGFIGAGIAASGIIYQIPVIGIGLSPLIPVVAIIGGIVGAPIGLVVGTVNAVKSLVSVLRTPPAAASARTGATKSGTRSNRHAAKPSAKASAPQQSSGKPRAGSGRDHTKAANRAARH